ncbi:MAG: hypothetical protein QWI36_03895 [Wolbachia endosymbiont of Tyrophagus putrescentiae]|nr:hypothetical protein [Wolbachia endosymbiont of Tyrophagus putrescentiae]
MKKIFKSNEKKLEEFYDKIEDIAAVSQDKFAHEIENLIYDEVNKFRTLLTKEINSIFKDIHSQQSSNFNSINRKGETMFISLLLKAAEHVIKNS